VQRWYPQVLYWQRYTPDRIFLSLLNSLQLALLFITPPEINKKQKAQQYKPNDRILVRLHTKFY
jgi:hypothetical protein